VDIDTFQLAGHVIKAAEAESWWDDLRESVAERLASSHEQAQVILSAHRRLRVLALEDAVGMWASGQHIEGATEDTAGNLSFDRSRFRRRWTAAAMGLHEDDVSRWENSVATSGHLNASYVGAGHCPPGISGLFELAATGIEALRDDIIQHRVLQEARSSPEVQRRMQEQDKTKHSDDGPRGGEDEVEAAGRRLEEEHVAASRKATTTLMALSNLGHPNAMKAAADLMHHPHRNIRTIALAVLSR